MSIPISSQTSASNSKKFRDISFSSYIDAAEETFVLQLGRSDNLSSSISTDHILFEKIMSEDTEIEVFDADRYFNGGSRLSSNPLPNNQDLKKHEIFEINDPPRIATASIRSVSSSNSRSALLHRASRNHQQQQRQTNKKNFLSSIRCNCYCNDRNSVEIKDYVAESCSIDQNLKPKEDRETGRHFVVNNRQTVYNYVKFDEPDLRLNPGGHFSFPVFNPKTGNHHQTARIQEQDPNHIRASKSLQVFGSPIQDNAKNGSDLERKLSVLTWDAIATGGRAEEVRIPPTTSYEDRDDDSDASSDLFEIESLSKGNSFLSQQGSDGLSEGCITPRNCYAPSEASVEWSVITASAADFSVLSDSEELRHNPTMQKKKETPKRRSGILSGGCKSQKAVRVAGDALQLNYDRKKGDRDVVRSESFSRMSRFYGESKISTSFDAVKRQQSFDGRVLSQSSSSSRNGVHLLHV